MSIIEQELDGESPTAVSLKRLGPFQTFRRLIYQILAVSSIKCKVVSESTRGNGEITEVFASQIQESLNS